MMLVSDMILAWDPAFRTHLETYAEDPTEGELLAKVSIPNPIFNPLPNPIPNPIPNPHPNPNPSPSPHNPHPNLTQGLRQGLQEADRARLRLRLRCFPFARARRGGEACAHNARQKRPGRRHDCSTVGGEEEQRRRTRARHDRRPSSPRLFRIASRCDLCELGGDVRRRRAGASALSSVVVVSNL